MKKLLKIVGFLALIVLVLTGCGKSSSASTNKAAKTTTVKIGITGSDDRIWRYVAKQVKKEGIIIKVVQFSDYNTPNQSLVDGDIDLNAFQTQLFLDNWNQQHHTDLVSIGKTVIAPMAIYSKKITKLSQLKKGATVSIPNDTTQGGRALELLKSAGLIDYKTKNQLPTVTDITKNKLGLKIKELDAAQLPKTLDDVDISVINSGVAWNAGLNPNKSVLLEKITKRSVRWMNTIAARKADRNKKVYKEIVKAYQTKAVKKLEQKYYGNSERTAWDIKF